MTVSEESATNFGNDLGLAINAYAGAVADIAVEQYRQRMLAMLGNHNGYSRGLLEVKLRQYKAEINRIVEQLAAGGAR